MSAPPTPAIPARSQSQHGCLQHPIHPSASAAMRFSALRAVLARGRAPPAPCSFSHTPYAMLAAPCSLPQCPLCHDANAPEIPPWPAARVVATDWSLAHLPPRLRAAVRTRGCGNGSRREPCWRGRQRSPVSGRRERRPRRACGGAHTTRRPIGRWRSSLIRYATGWDRWNKESPRGGEPPRRAPLASYGAWN